MNWRLALTLSLSLVAAAPPRLKETATIRLAEDEVAAVWIHPEGSVLSFAAKPSQVILGREGQFDVQYVGADLAITALVPGAAVSAFVYLLGRRYAFSLKTAKERSPRLIFVRDAKDGLIEVEAK